MRFIRRKKIHVITAFCVLYLGTACILFREATPGNRFELQTNSPEYDFGRDFKQWQNDESATLIAHAAKMDEEKMDWHNYDLIHKERLRKGNGEQGEPVVPSSQDIDAVPSKFKDIGYNVATSMKISLNRALPDLRHPLCFKKFYRRNLPRASIIIPFHNELNITLLRTIHSIVRHSPTDLLNDIVLVDDASTDEELLEPLERYLNSTFPDIRIKIIRIAAQQGLMKARSLGIAHAMGEIMVLFDAHIEVGINFLPPLLEPIAENYRTITNPIVGIIDNHSFRISIGALYSGGVNTKMNFTYFDANPKDISKPTMPYPNPVMIGCAFAISKRWWEELEGYDPLLKMWGSEQIELSYKTWMCGGQQVNVPCSIIFHLFRPRREGTSKEDVTARENNLHRVALAWMDEYVDYVYLTYPRLLAIKPGDVSPQLRLRRKLKCKSFDWFMTNVQPEILRLDPTPKLPFDAWGKLSSRQDSTKCIRIRGELGVAEFILTDCQWGDDGLMPEHFHYTRDGLLSTTVWKPSRCLVPSSTQLDIQLTDCLGNEQRQKWAYNSITGHVTNIQSQMCMEKGLYNAWVRLRPCEDANDSQSWNYQFVNPTVRFY